MRVEFSPRLPSGTVAAPPSKSELHRLLICAGLSEGKSLIKNVSYSQDISATIDCLDRIGCEIEKNGSAVAVTGLGGLPEEISGELDCRECGSTLRFFIPILAASTGGSLRGSEKLLERPLSVYETVFAERGISFERTAGQVRVGSGFDGGRITAAGNVSSQFISGFLFAMPYLDKGGRIELTGKVESRPYIDMTLAALSAFGTDAGWESERILGVRGSQVGKAAEITANGDWSNAAFWLALNAMGADITVTGLDRSDAQGDKACEEIFKKIKDGNALIDLSDCPDLGPVSFAVAAANGGAVFTGTERLKIKESDRIESMKDELARFGVTVTEKGNSVEVSGGLRKPDGTLDGHNDHRIVMACSCLLTLTGGSIEGAGAVSKSYPDFFEKLRQLGAEIEIADTEVPYEA